MSRFVPITNWASFHSKFVISRDLLCVQFRHAFWCQFRRNIALYKPQRSSLVQKRYNISVIPSYLQPFAYDSVENALNRVKKVDFFNAQSVRLLKVIRVQVLLKRTSLQKIENDPCFEMLCNVFSTSCWKFQPSLLISGLRSLLEIGIVPESNIIEQVERVIIFKMDSFKMIDLISCLHLHSKYHSTDLQKHVMKALTEEIQYRTDGVNTVAEALMLVQCLHLFSNEGARALEGRIIKFLDMLSAVELSKVICSLSEQKVRNKPLLKAVALNIRKCEKPNLKETTNILYSCLNLNFFDSDLFLYLTENREGDIAAVTQPSVISSFLTVCGQLKWRHSGLLDACCQWITKHRDSCVARDFVSLILTLAALNYVPDSSVIKDIVACLKFEQVANKKIWLDVVWSLAIINYFDKTMLTEVLTPEFYRPLLDQNSEDIDFQPISTKLKLMNLVSVQKYLHPQSVFSCKLFLEPEEMLISKESENCRKAMLSALKSFIPEKTHMHTNLSTVMGVNIDAEFAIDKSGKPLPLNEYGVKAKPTLVKKALPAGAKRFALMALLYKDHTLNEKCLIGSTALAVKLLAMNGYVVVQVPYEEFAKHMTTLKKVKYLADLISKSFVEQQID